tara:strand:- start:238 stop:372 length:135 start_codon:yes stop_codon:yes gene_type:complete
VEKDILITPQVVLQILEVAAVLEQLVLVVVAAVQVMVEQEWHHQ